ncbi:MAG: alpha-ketoglutarate-dependent dioxygenase AlkB [Gammaproteobacteria bacterium]|nr:alpha-ketoglutarate-dependent dioxygenase AlkB [Gammaproteobacteria bacterium]
MVDSKHCVPSLLEGAQHIPLTEGEVCYWPEWLDDDDARALFRTLRDEIAWEQSMITLFGQPRAIPRLNAWYADDGLTYTYSRKTFEPHPWTSALLGIRRRVEATTGYEFNSVLANLYRDGRDSNGWHSDDEPELGQNPIIASVSLGGERKFHLRHRTRKDIDRLHLTLEHGSLLLMTGRTRRCWAHQLPKTAKAVAPRINLTFRRINPY